MKCTLFYHEYLEIFIFQLIKISEENTLSSIFPTLKSTKNRYSQLFLTKRKKWQIPDSTIPMITRFWICLPSSNCSDDFNPSTFSPLSTMPEFRNGHLVQVFNLEGFRCLLQLLGFVDPITDAKLSEGIEEVGEVAVILLIQIWIKKTVRLFVEKDDWWIFRMKAFNF